MLAKLMISGYTTIFVSEDLFVLFYKIVGCANNRDISVGRGVVL